ncbi:MAG TPA: tail fiber domain-containing protein [Candidatus Bathyarchaeia archaeon]|nr:tail fiber domain-containing protein [Candidatus Bathyarchaeia archaeon]
MKRRFVKPRVRDTVDVSSIVRGVGTSSLREQSSRRSKMNIRKVQDALDKIVQLRGVTFDWKDSGRPDIGLIAEEVGKVVPEVVTYEDNGVDAKSLDYAHLVALIIEAMKEQQRVIDNQRIELEEIKAAVKILSAQKTKRTVSSFT